MSNKDETIKQHVFVMDWIREVTGNNKIEGRITVDEYQLKCIMEQYARKKCKEQRELVRDGIKDFITNFTNKNVKGSEDAIFKTLLNDRKGEFCRICLESNKPKFN